MTTLNLNILRPEARALYQVLHQAHELAGLTLLGGTALALQLGHRYSLDFIFATFDERLPTQRIEMLVSRMKTDGHDVHLITDWAQASQFKINTGESLLHFARDYVMNGVKVTFFSHGKNPSQREYYRAASKTCMSGHSFDILGLAGLKTAKTLVLADRVRSRDLFDLMVLMRDCDYSMDEAMKIVARLGHNDDPEYYKAVMTGLIPLDRGDEGLEPVDVTITPSDLYAFFDERLAEYETRLAEDYFSGRK